MKKTNFYKRNYRRFLYAVMSAITTTSLISYSSSLISVRNEDAYTLKFGISFLNKIVKTFDVKKELNFHQHSFKTHYEYWDTLIATRKNVGAIWLPFITIK